MTFLLSAGGAVEAKLVREHKSPDPEAFFVGYCHPELVIGIELILAHGRFLHNAQSLARSFVLQKLCGSLFRLLVNLREEPQPQYGHLFLGNALGSEFRKFNKYEAKAFDDAVGVGHVDDGIVVVELIGLALKADVVDQVQTIDWMNEVVALTFLQLLHDGLAGLRSARRPHCPSCRDSLAPAPMANTPH